MIVHVLRLGHRIVRDKRITTHCCLVSRAFGASKIILSGEEDKRLVEGVDKIKEQWGGKFEIGYREDWKKVLKEYRADGWKIAHLTMYGHDVDLKKKEMQAEEKILLIIGAEKVPIEVYKEADYNVAVKNQPHSEVAALAIVLDRLGIEGDFSGAKKEIVPGEKDKGE